MEAVLDVHETHLAHGEGVPQVCDTPPSSCISACHGCLRYSLSGTLLVAKVSCSLCSGREAVIGSMGLVDIQRRNVQILVLVVADEPMKVDHYRKSF